MQVQANGSSVAISQRCGSRGLEGQDQDEAEPASLIQ